MTAHAFEYPISESDYSGTDPFITGYTNRSDLIILLHDTRWAVPNRPTRADRENIKNIPEEIKNKALTYADLPTGRIRVSAVRIFGHIYIIDLEQDAIDGWHMSLLFDKKKDEIQGQVFWYMSE